LANLARENLSGMRVIRAFGRQKREAAQMADASDALTALITRVGKISMALNPITTLIVNAAIIGIVWLGAHFAGAGQIVPGEIVALVAYMNQTLLALIVMANMIVLLTNGLAGARRVAAVLDIPAAPDASNNSDTSDGSETSDDSESADTPKRATRDSADIIRSASAVRFENVSFSYHPGAGDVLQDISFTIETGQTVGIIGGTGSGKTTIINLIMRYFDTDRGQVLVTDHQLKPQALRSMIGIVPQKAALFSGTVRGNLKMAKPDASDAELWRALDAAQAADFVRKMPRGLDSALEEGGKTLSGGQRQRLTIARALLRRPKLLILDDATSALDYATDAAFRDALHRESQTNPGMTVITVNQRISSIRHADNILVLDGGRLVGQGTHETLLRENTVYREICLSQGFGDSGGGTL
jgi:ATP-binding cassette subfamily B protein